MLLVKGTSLHNADNAPTERQKKAAREKIEDVVKGTAGNNATLMARGNYGRKFLQKDVADNVSNSMPTEVNEIQAEIIEQ